MKLNQPVNFILFVALLMAACGDKNEKKITDKEEDKEVVEIKEESSGPASKLEGSWEIMRATGDMSSMNVGTIYEFKGNKLSFKSPGFTNPGTTEVTDKTFSFQAEGNELKFMYDYKMEGDTLVVSMQKSDQTFYMVKK